MAISKDHCIDNVSLKMVASLSFIVCNRRLKLGLGSALRVACGNICFWGLQSHFLGGPGIVETLERIGLERLMSTTPPTSPPQTTQSSTTAGTAAGVALGVPGTPGSGVLASRLSQLPGGSSRGSGGGGGRAGRQPRVRADLGTVPGQTNNSPSSSLGTLSSMLFGRKGGLL
ncbi:hypothetical protein J6590_037879 [Homalodisca vitripennis]|nr:hypothetical protein J6590_037879 [Homalodisca vitripennis]